MTPGRADAASVCPGRGWRRNAAPARTRKVWLGLHGPLAAALHEATTQGARLNTRGAALRLPASLSREQAPPVHDPGGVEGILDPSQDLHAALAEFGG